MISEAVRIGKAECRSFWLTLSWEEELNDFEVAMKKLLHYSLDNERANVAYSLYQYGCFFHEAVLQSYTNLIDSKELRFGFSLIYSYSCFSHSSEAS